MNHVNLIKKAVSATVRANPLLVLLYVAFFGAMVVIASFVQEISHQQSLMATQGYDALLAYRALVQSHQLGFQDYLVQSISGNLPSISAPIRGVGYWIMFVVAPAVAILLAIVRVVRFAMAGTPAVRSA